MKTNNHLDDFAGFGKTSRFAAGQVKGKNCVIYTRVSSKEQKDGFSLETQLEENRQGCEKADFNVLEYFGGVYESAKTDERNEFNRMLKYIKNSKIKIDYIVVSDATRFSRSGANAIYIAEQLRKENVSIYTVNCPADTQTATGKMQQNMQFIIAQFDSDLKREKIVANSRQMLLQGYWCAKAPIGYSQLTKRKRQNQDLPERQIIKVNETGKLIRKAFMWKYHEKISNTEILYRLEKLGLKLRKQKMSEIFSNPFYCGILTHNWLNNEVVEGKHEKLISREIFLAVNNIKSRAVKWKHGTDFTNVPLKNFMRCSDCGTNFVGYLVKRKNLYYYKCNKLGCKNNRSANDLHTAFITDLQSVTIQERYLEPIKTEFINFYSQLSEESGVQLEALKTRLNEVEKSIEALEERYAIGKLEDEIYLKFHLKYKKERAEICKEIDKATFENSNLEKRVNKYLALLSNPALLWERSGYVEKMEFQKLLFPYGLVYDREIRTYRTPQINPVVAYFNELVRTLEGKQIGDKANFNTLSPYVPPTGTKLNRF